MMKNLIIFLILVGGTTLFCINIPLIIFGIPKDIYGDIQATKVDTESFEHLNNVVEWVGTDKDKINIATNILLNKEYFERIRTAIILSLCGGIVIALILGRCISGQETNEK